MHGKSGSARLGLLYSETRWRQKQISDRLSFCFAAQDHHIERVPNKALLQLHVMF